MQEMYTLHLFAIVASTSSAHSRFVRSGFIVSYVITDTMNIERTWKQATVVNDKCCKAPYQMTHCSNQVVGLISFSHVTAN